MLGNIGKYFLMMKVVFTKPKKWLIFWRLLFNEIQLIGIDTSEQTLERVNCDYKLLIGEEQFKGHGSGGDLTKVELAFANEKEKIQKMLEGVDMLFIAGGFGKGTGSVGLISLGKMAKEL